jgi:hypothetical protein
MTYLRGRRAQCPERTLGVQNRTLGEWTAQSQGAPLVGNNAYWTVRVRLAVWTRVPLVAVMTTEYCPGTEPEE